MSGVPCNKKRFWWPRTPSNCSTFRWWVFLMHHAVMPLAQTQKIKADINLNRNIHTQPRNRHIVRPSAATSLFSHVNIAGTETEGGNVSRQLQSFRKIWRPETLQRKLSTWKTGLFRGRPGSNLLYSETSIIQYYSTKWSRWQYWRLKQCASQKNEAITNLLSYQTPKDVGAVHPVQARHPLKYVHGACNDRSLAGSVETSIVGRFSRKENSFAHCPARFNSTQQHASQHTTQDSSNTEKWATKPSVAKQAHVAPRNLRSHCSSHKP